MFNENQKKEFYQALLNKDTLYEGVFFVGVLSTGIFCRPSCPARKPKAENCLFYPSAQDALFAGFRPCKRCRPLSVPNELPPVVQRLVEAVEEEPERRWRDSDFRELGLDASTARRQFKKRFGMTFVAYARARRMGLALKQIREGESVISAQLNAGYESGSGFRDAFSRIMGAAPSQSKEASLMKAAWLETPLGPVLAIADDSALYLLEFVDRRGLEREIERMRSRCNCAIVPGDSLPLRSIRQELAEYFNGERSNFETPLALLGSEFQQQVWAQLQRIPIGETCSYSALAAKLGRPTAARAVARANGSNQLAIVIPCHRVINANGELGGYGGGLRRKQWLLEHEKKMAT